MDDEFYMRRALELARLTVGQTRPNPSVGCILVGDGRVVGTGTHLQAGGPHAEAFAVRQAGDRARGATAYVTLEPCAHHGRTPPCADLLIEAGVARIVVATADENPLVAGKGIDRLRKAGIAVEVGLLAEEARRINEAFFLFHRERRPRVTLKAAVSLDGRIATHTGESRWISGPESRTDAHLLRHGTDAILVGIGTVLADDPELTARLPNGSVQPLRVVLDSRLRTPPASKVVNGAAPTVIFTTQSADPAATAALEASGAEVVYLGERISVAAVLDRLAARNIQSLLVEGGATIHGAFLDAGLFDEIVLYVAPRLIGGIDAPCAFGGTGIASVAAAPELEIRDITRTGDDVRIVAVPKRRPPCSPAS